MDVEALRQLMHEPLELRRRLGQAVGIVQLDSFLKLALQLLLLTCLRAPSVGQCTKNEKKPNEPRGHSNRMLAPAGKSSQLPQSVLRALGKGVRTSSRDLGA